VERLLLIVGLLAQPRVAMFVVSRHGTRRLVIASFFALRGTSLHPYHRKTLDEVGVNLVPIRLYSRGLDFLNIVVHH
jgi:hypothetical protein